tara:strand:+ start:7898 stop:8125 length:228 start_codon:yes stop_codon:yes gene_type:complete
MIITKKSAYSGIQHRKDIPVCPEDWALYKGGYGSISETMPYLTDEDREFILSGMLPNEWALACSEIKAIVEDSFA